VVQRWSIYVCMPRFGVKNVGFNLCLDETKLIAAARIVACITYSWHYTYGSSMAVYAAGTIVCP